MFPTVHHQFQHPLHRPSLTSHSHQHIIKSIPTSDSLHNLGVTNINNGSSLLTTHNNKLIVTITIIIHRQY